MPTSSNPRSARGLVRPVTVAAVVTLLGLALALAAGSASNNADAAKSKATVLGGATTMQDPLCPERCQMLPTGNSPYRATANGKITAWKLWLGKPDAKDRAALNARFGSPPQAAITVLKPVKTRKGTKFKLRSKSPVEGLNRELGGVATFRLEEPLRIRTGNYVALSVPTWAPAFADGLGSRYAWRASRQPGKCGPNTIDQARSQLKVGSTRYYACNFKGSRLLFTAKLKFDK
jgi:hypothetical protein